ncbi:MAG: phosphoribosylformylglycinamidine synthase subunit PurQ [Candidatus Hatepunaea meridiana]|nr:phosphoribosylformylglycinamidine synthase subunit PurQ [Candidatus Hatepunaea meridiana]
MTLPERNTNLTKRVTRLGVVIFPGSNCDKDALDAIGRICGQDIKPIWHRDTNLDDMDAVILPGGFSYGDYLRAGAIARFAPVVEKLIAFADRGGLVIGICNGFQVLTETKLLPGALMRNEGLRFICREVFLRVERTDTPFTRNLQSGQVIKFPIAHNEGNFYLPSDELKKLEKNQQVLFRYCDAEGNVTPKANPNGSLNNIAGIVNIKGNVLGMMPHPERRCDPLLGEPDGVGIFESVIDSIR